MSGVSLYERRLRGTHTLNVKCSLPFGLRSQEHPPGTEGCLASQGRALGHVPSACRAAAAQEEARAGPSGGGPRPLCPGMGRARVPQEVSSVLFAKSGLASPPAPSPAVPASGPPQTQLLPGRPALPPPRLQGGADGPSSPPAPTPGGASLNLCQRPAEPRGIPGDGAKTPPRERSPPRSPGCFWREIRS